MSHLDDFHTRLSRTYAGSHYARYRNGGVVELARVAGLHRHTVYRLLHGKHRPTEATRKALARALCVPDSLFCADSRAIDTDHR